MAWESFVVVSAGLNLSFANSDSYTELYIRAYKNLCSSQTHLYRPKDDGINLKPWVLT